MCANDNSQLKDLLNNIQGIVASLSLMLGGKIFDFVNKDLQGFSMETFNCGMKETLQMNVNYFRKLIRKFVITSSKAG